MIDLGEYLGGIAACGGWVVVAVVGDLDHLGLGLCGQRSKVV